MSKKVKLKSFGRCQFNVGMLPFSCFIGKFENRNRSPTNLRGNEQKIVESLLERCIRTRKGSKKFSAHRLGPVWNCFHILRLHFCSNWQPSTSHTLRDLTIEFPLRTCRSGCILTSGRVDVEKSTKAQAPNEGKVDIRGQLE